MIAFDRLMIVYDWFKNLEREKHIQDQMQTTCNKALSLIDLLMQLTCNKEKK